MASFKDGTDALLQSRCRQKMIDEDVFRAAVLRSPPDLSEDELDHRLELEARVLGLQWRPQSADHLTSSISAMTISSDFDRQSSAVSQSTNPTSCSSSDRRPTHILPATYPQSNSPPRSETPSIHSITEKRSSIFRNGIRRISVFRKRRSGISISANTPIGTEQDTDEADLVDRGLSKEILDSPLSTTSRKSSWSMSTPLAVRSNVGEITPDDKEATTRTEECTALRELQAQQGNERDRFLQFQSKYLNDMRVEYEQSKKQKVEAQAAAVRAAKTKVLAILPLPFSSANCPRMKNQSLI
jgi:hypothetical protein